MTKKIFAILMALVLTLAMTTVAFAAEAITGGNSPDNPASTTVGNTTYTDVNSVDLGKEYKLISGAVSNPAETFKFKVEKESCTDSTAYDIDTMPMVGQKAADGNYYVEIGFSAKELNAELETPVTSKTNTARIDLPTYAGVGIYTYKLTEVPGTTLGVTYNTENNAVYLKVTVINDGTIRVAALRLTNASNGTKIASGEAAFKNTFSAAPLNVTKQVEGTMGDKEKFFAVTITLTNTTSSTIAANTTYDVTYTTDKSGNDALTALTTQNAGKTSISVGTPLTVYLRDDDTVHIANLPKGLTYEVEEEDVSADGYTVALTGDITTNGGTATVAALTDNTSEDVTITNTKGGTIDTGITMDSIPYIVLLAVVAIGVVAMLLKKRHEA